MLLPAQAKQVVFSHQAQYPLVVDYLTFTLQSLSQQPIATETMMLDC
jgi:hypothetical protein